VEDGVRLGARFFPWEPAEPHVIFFHGNGEIASDYNDIGPIYNQHNLNLIVVDYRGYGHSTGQPTASSLLSDARTVFCELKDWLESQDRTGSLIAMGRSLGSVPALEIGCCYPNDIDGLIIDSGFARTVPLLNRLGVATDTLGITEMDGFANFDKIREIDKPTLIIHGQEDDMIPVEDAELLLRNAGTSRKHLMLAPGCGHNDILLRCEKAYFETIGHFVDMLKRIKQ
jgi:alpha-beta hydrolase superfamily lysophospholipase